MNLLLSLKILVKVVVSFLAPQVKLIGWIKITHTLFNLLIIEEVYLSQCILHVSPLYYSHISTETVILTENTFF